MMASPLLDSSGCKRLSSEPSARSVVKVLEGQLGDAHMSKTAESGTAKHEAKVLI